MPVIENLHCVRVWYFQLSLEKSILNNQNKCKIRHWQIQYSLWIFSTSGRNLCKDAEPSSGGFVRCNSTSSLDDICQLNKSSPLTWWATHFFLMSTGCVSVHPVTYTCLIYSFLLEPNSNPAPKLKTDSCSSEYHKHRCFLYSPLFIKGFAAVTMFVWSSGEMPRFCDCTAFCNSTRKKNNHNIALTFLESRLLLQYVMSECTIVIQI